MRSLPVVSVLVRWHAPSRLVVEVVGLDALLAKVFGEVGVAVEGVDYAGFGAVDVLQELGEVGVVGEGDHLVDAIAVAGAGVHGPAGEHDGAVAGEGGGDLAAEVGRGEDDLAAESGDAGEVEGLVRTERDALALVDLGDT